MSAVKLYFTSSGMVCAVGHSAAAACAAIRADLSGFEELRYMDNTGAPILGAAVSGVPIIDEPIERLGALLAMAVADCMKHSATPRGESIPLLLGVAEPARPGGTAERWGEIIPGLERRLKVRFHPMLSKIIASGHTAAFQALSEAREIIDGGAASICLVAGVDSYLDVDALLWLDTSYRLKTSENSDGIIPGEAAACVMVERRSRHDAAPLKLVGLGFGHEAASVLTEEPALHGAGMAAAMRAALAEAGLGMHEVDFRISDVAGESYGFKELSLSLSKVLRVRREAFPLWHPADAIGDTGAAAGVCQIVVAMHAVQKGYAPGRRIICCGSALEGARAAAILEG